MLDRFARLVLVALALLVVAFFVASQVGVEPPWVAVGFAVFLGAAALVAHRDRFAALVGATSPRFLVFVAALAIVVDAAVGHGLGDAAERAIPDGASLPTLLTIVADRRAAGQPGEQRAGHAGAARRGGRDRCGFAGPPARGR